uniref:Uncharacterized protein n=2 Tax=Steinernema glaseri TaxID=37863 RepID=A0A1I7YFG4_9BILA
MSSSSVLFSLSYARLIDIEEQSKGFRKTERTWGNSRICSEQSCVPTRNIGIPDPASRPDPEASGIPTLKSRLLPCKGLETSRNKTSTRPTLSIEKDNASMVLQKRRDLFSTWVFRNKSRPEFRTIGIPDPTSRPDPEVSGIPTRNPVTFRNPDPTRPVPKSGSGHSSGSEQQRTCKMAREG